MAIASRSSGVGVIPSLSRTENTNCFSIRKNALTSDSDPSGYFSELSVVLIIAPSSRTLSPPAPISVPVTTVRLPISFPTRGALLLSAAADCPSFNSSRIRSIFSRSTTFSDFTFARSIEVNSASPAPIGASSGLNRLPSKFTTAMLFSGIVSALIPCSFCTTSTASCFSFWDISRSRWLWMVDLIFPLGFMFSAAE